MSPGNIPSSEQRIIIEGNGIIILYRERTCRKWYFPIEKCLKNTRPLSWNTDFQRFEPRNNERAKYFILRGYFSLSHFSRVLQRVSILSPQKKTTLLISFSIHRFDKTVSIFPHSFISFLLSSSRGNDNLWNGKITIKWLKMIY